MEKITQQIDQFWQVIKAEFLAHPSWGYLLLVLAFAIYLIGIILNKDWAVHPAGYYSGWHMIEEFFGRRGLRIVSGFFIFVAILGLIYLFLKTY